MFLIDGSVNLHGNQSGETLVAWWGCQEPWSCSAPIIDCLAICVQRPGHCSLCWGRDSRCGVLEVQGRPSRGHTLGFGTFILDGHPTIWNLNLAPRSHVIVMWLYEWFMFPFDILCTRTLVLTPLSWLAVYVGNKFIRYLLSLQMVCITSWRCMILDKSIPRNGQVALDNILFLLQPPWHSWISE